MAVVSNVEIRVNAKNAIQQLERIRGVTSKLPGTFTNSAAASKKLSGGLGVAATAASGFGTALKSALAPLLAIGVAVSAVSKSFTVMGQRQADVAALENGLQNLGVTGDQVLTALQAKADAFGKVTLFSEEDYTRAATQLTSFTNISVSAFDRVINVAGDVAQVMNQDVNSAVTQLAKALNAPTQNLSALSRSGIQFTEQQKEQIKALESSGKLQAAQGLILAELERQYQGAAAAAGGAGLAGALDGLSEVANDAFEVFGKILEPIAVPIIQGITKAIQVMSNTWEYISGVIFPNIVAAVQPLTDALKRIFTSIDIEAFGVVFRNVLIKNFETLIAVIGAASRVLGVLINAFVDLSNNPAFKFIGQQVVKLADLLGLTTDKVGEFNNAQRTSQAEADKILAAQNKISSAADTTSLSQKEINETLKEQTSLIEQNARNQSQSLSNNLKLVDARFGAEKQLLQNQIEQANAAGKTQEVYKLKNKLAQLDYEISVQRIKTEVRKLEIAKQLAIAKQKELQVALALSEEGSKQMEKLKNALNLQTELVRQASNNLSLGRQIAKEQIKQAEAIKEGAEQANLLASRTASVAANTGQASKAAASFANNMERGAAAAAQAASSAEQAAAASSRGGATPSGRSFTTKLPPEFIKSVVPKTPFKNLLELRDFLKRYNDMIKEGDEYVRTQRRYTSLLNTAAKYAETGARQAANIFIRSAEIVQRTAPRDLILGPLPSRYQSGGYVSSPTNAVIGEGGSEYVIPSSKMAAAMERYAAGKRGNEVVPNGNETQVNVSTGPVMQMNGQNYVTQSDFERGLRSTVNQVMTTLRRSPNTRAAVGI